MQPTSTPLEIGSTIRHHRKRAGLSRRELAMIADVGTTVIYEIEKGKESVRLDIVLRLLRALNIALVLESPLDENGARTEGS